LQLVKKWFKHRNIIFRQGRGDLGREHFVTQCGWVKRGSIRDARSKPMLKRRCTRSEISAKAAAV